MMVTIALWNEGEEQSLNDLLSFMLYTLFYIRNKDRRNTRLKSGKD